MKRLRSKLTYANVTATLALFLALAGGTAYAAGKIQSSDIAAGAVTTANLAQRSVTSGKLAIGAVSENQIADEAVGLQQISTTARTALAGAQGPKGEAGPMGETGPAGTSTDSAELERRLSALETANEELGAELASATTKVTALETTFSGVSREGTTLNFTGMNLQLTNGEASDETTNGLGNLFVGQNDEPGPQTGSGGIIVGERGETFTGWDSMIVGNHNTVSGGDSFVASTGSTAGQAGGMVLGGWENLASGVYATVVGGIHNTASGSFSTERGGSEQTVSTEAGFGP
jgi:hypothetical protein